MMMSVRSRISLSLPLSQPLIPSQDQTYFCIHKALANLSEFLFILVRSTFVYIIAPLSFRKRFSMAFRKKEKKNHMHFSNDPILFSTLDIVNLWRNAAFLPLLQRPLLKGTCKLQTSFSSLVS